MLNRLIMQPILAQADLSPEFIIILIAVLAIGGVAAALLLKKARAKKGEPEEPISKPGEPEAIEPKLEAAPEPKPEQKTKEPPLKILEGKTLAESMARTKKEGFVAKLTGIFKKELDDDLHSMVEEILLTSDIGIKTSQKLLDGMEDDLSREQLKQSDQVWEFLRKEISGILTAADKAPGEQDAKPSPEVILVVGVNGVGKTTSIGKLAQYHIARGRKVLMVAGDTFRAAAVEQLQIWAERTGAGFFRGQNEADPASVVFDGLKHGKEESYDLILVDTAGRLHTDVNLVEELKKIHRVAGKAILGAPSEVLLVLDATNGQNALHQADVFGTQVAVSGIVLSKLDGTAKGGVIIGICDTFGIPVQWVGTGEKAEDLRKFNAEEFINLLFDID
jgi:fused signal recognition particle receptor